jgi:hypothetical protein
MASKLCVTGLVTLFICCTAVTTARAQGDPATVSRLNQIASDMVREADPTADLTEACKLIGFAIWTDDSMAFHPQSSSAPLHLAITQGEIRDAAQQFRRTQSTHLSDLGSAFDDMVTKMGVHVSISASLNAFLSDSGWSSNKSVFYLQSFLHDLSSVHMQGTSMAFGPDSNLDPVQTLLIMRVVSEDIATPIRRHLKGHTLSSASDLSRPYGYPGVLSAATIAQAGAENIPAYSESSYGGTLGDVWNEMSHVAGEVKEAAEAIVETVSVGKFISAYLKLQGDVELDPPPPLIRTTDRLEEGALATLKATFKIAGDANSQSLQALHSYLGKIGGFVLGQPKDVPLKDVETAWVIGQSTKYATRQLIQTQQGKSVDLSKVKTDENGVASVPIAGKPQFQDIDKNTAQKVTKHVIIKVTPQLESNELVDEVVKIGLGVKGGGVGGALKIIEGFVGRMKWAGTVNYDLVVTDWAPGDVIGTLTAELSASYTDLTMVMDTGQTTINRSLSIESARLSVLNIPQISIPQLDQKALSYLSEAQKAQLAAAMQQAQAQVAKANSTAAASAGVMRYMVAGDSGSWSMKVADQSYGTRLAQNQGEATHGAAHRQGDTTGDGNGTYEGKGGPSFTIEDHQKDGYILLSGLSGSVTATTRYQFQDESNPSLNQKKDTSGPFQFMDGVNIDKSALVNGAIKLTVKPGSVNGIGGSATVPCTVDGHPATLVISYSITMKKKT